MLHFIQKGKGEKVIFFIHGNSQSANIWDEIMKSDLGKDYTLISVDLPGHGQSIGEKFKSDYSIKGFAKRLEEFIRSKSDTNYILVGNSLAANIIGEIVLELKNCKGILLTGATLIGKKISLSQIVQPNPNIAICFAPDFTEEQLDLMVTDSGYKLSEDKKNIIKQNYREADPMMRVGLANSIANMEYSDGISNLELSKIPVGIVYGEEEKFCFKDALEKSHFPMWKGKTILIQESGHCCHVDQPEKVTSIIHEFASACL